MKLFNANRMLTLSRKVSDVDTFIKEVMRFYKWYLTPEMRFWTKEHLRGYYELNRGTIKKT
jgi:hypothetical protein